MEKAKGNPEAQRVMISQALCPLGITVVMAGNSNSQNADAKDYQPIGTNGNVINYDPQLNTKKAHPAQKDAEARSLEPNYGYNFRVGSTLYAVLSPKTLERAFPTLVQRDAEHELYGATEHTVKKSSSETSDDAEVDTWTHDFLHYFHLLGQKAGSKSGEKYAGESWKNLLKYYENATDVAVRKKAIQQIDQYYRNPPSSDANSGRRGHPTTPEQVKETFDLWFREREAESPGSQFVQDWNAAHGQPGEKK